MSESESNFKGPERVCPSESAGWLSTPVRTLFTNPTRILKGLVGRGGIAVDLGCGPGFFTLPLARMVGEAGRVIAVDVQPEMLAKLDARAQKAGLASRIELHHADPNAIGVGGPVDFVLAFWMLHEVPAKAEFLEEAHDLLKEGGRFLLVEPMGHVSKSQYLEVEGLAGQAGLTPVARPRIFLSRATLFKRP